MAEPEMPPLARVPRQEDPEHKMREEIIGKGRKLGEAVETRLKAEMALAGAQAAYDESVRDVKLRRDDWRKALANYSLLYGPNDSDG